jgi:hypothetical protein
LSYEQLRDTLERNLLKMAGTKQIREFRDAVYKNVRKNVRTVKINVKWNMRKNVRKVKRNVRTVKDKILPGKTEENDEPPAEI